MIKHTYVQRTTRVQTGSDRGHADRDLTCHFHGDTKDTSLQTTNFT